MKCPRFLLAVAAVGVGVVTSGCARSAVSTEVRADGSWTRSLKFSGQPSGAKGQGSPVPSIRDVFDLPTGAGWTTTIKREENEVIYTAVRNLAKGGTFKGDVVVKGKVKGEPGKVLTNEVTLREIGPGRFEYRETLHWLGERPEELKARIPELDKMLKQALPAALATDEDVKALSAALIREFWHVMFGPNEPLIATLALHPDLMERMVRRRISAAAVMVLEQRYGDRMNRTDRVAVVRKMVDGMMSATDSFTKAQKKAGQMGGGGDSDMPVPMVFSVRMPGRVISTNGVVDESTDEVYWALYSLSPAVEDVVMVATCDVSP